MRPRSPIGITAGLLHLFQAAFFADVGVPGGEQFGHFTFPAAHELEFVLDQQLFPVTATLAGV